MRGVVNRLRFFFPFCLSNIACLQIKTSPRICVYCTCNLSPASQQNKTLKCKLHMEWKFNLNWMTWSQGSTLKHWPWHVQAQQQRGVQSCWCSVMPDKCSARFYAAFWPRLWEVGLVSWWNIWSRCQFSYSGIGHKILQFYWLRAVVKFYNVLLSSKVPLLSRSFSLTSSCCLWLKHVGLRTSCAPLRDCGAVIHMHKLSRRGTLFVTQIPLLT